ncbi:MAG: trypsin-like peptidase domain-containing protein [Acidimicrobiales bacterium]|nr:trypsin-like peptidase domain-containing protein [Acidimicrobiales bacterium]MDP6697064.1 trypsin-like peptidase domain-containing protein [Acidimicrobiales bacterium]
MITDLVACLAGMAVLVVAADHFVLGSARLARALSMSPIVIGAVVLGFGTSAPEMLVSAIAANRGNLALGVGNVVGSNVANLSLVAAVAALLTRMPIAPSVFRREALLSVIAAVAFALVVTGGYVSRLEGLFLALGIVASIVALVVTGRQEDHDDEPIDEGHSTGFETLRVTVGLTGTVLAAHFVVTGASGLADHWGLTGGFIGFSLVALGTSLPELVTTVACARRGETDLIVGNLLGSNVFNSLAVGGAIGLVGPGEIGDSHLEGKGIALMLVVGVGAVALARWGHYLGRVDGVILLGLYVSAMVILGAGGRQDESASPNERSVSIRTTGCGHVSKTRGSGVAVGGDLVVTVAHVVVGASTVHATTPDDVERPGSIVALDARRDLALISVPGLDAPPVVMADDSTAGSGLIVGGARSGTVVADIRRRVPVVIEEIGSADRYQRDGYEVGAVTGRGDSGAGLYNDEGSLLGVVFATASDDDLTTWVTASTEIEEVLTVGRGPDYRCDEMASRVVRTD